MGYVLVQEYFIKLPLLTWPLDYYRVPETKGEDFGELTMLFENHVSARDFATYSVKNPKTGSLRE